MKAVLCAALAALPLTGAFAQSLPAVETLTSSSSFAAFVAADVPVDVQRQALRRLWALAPALSGPDLLDIHALEGAPGATAAAQPAALITPATFVQQTSVVPPVDALSRQSDYTVYLAQDVPLAVHQAAMRRLWSTHPEFARYSDDPMHAGEVAETVADRPQTHASATSIIAITSID